MGDKTKLTSEDPAPTSSLDELIAKAPVAKLKDIRSLLFNKISSAALNRDVAKVDQLSSLAKECEMLETKSEKLETEITAFHRCFIEAVNDSGSLPKISAKPTYSDSAEAVTLSPKAAAAQERDEWVARLRTKGISLYGHGKQYQTARGQSVALAFANELLGLENQWFLGIADEEPTAAVVLLCKSLEGKLHDIVLPVSHLHKVWSVLNRSSKQVKFHVQEKDAGHFSLRIPKASRLDITWLDITRYKGNYDPLR